MTNDKPSDKEAAPRTTQAAQEPTDHKTLPPSEIARIKFEEICCGGGRPPSEVKEH